MASKMEKLKVIPRKYPRFSDFAKDEAEGPLSGEKIKMEKILGKEIVVLDFRVRKSKIKDGEYTIIQFIKEDKKYVVFTGSSVLRRQLETYKNKLPFIAVINKINNYLTFT